MVSLQQIMRYHKINSEDINKRLEVIQAKINEYHKVDFPQKTTEKKKNNTADTNPSPFKCVKTEFNRTMS